MPNAITLLRTGAAVTMGLLATATGDLRLLGLAYAVYWVGDILDGWSARRLGQETRLGAVLDIVSDRACTAVLLTGLLATVDDGRALVPVAAVFLVSFMVVDTLLSLAFLLWPILGPNDFHLVDRRVWLLNWSPAAKAANTGMVVVAIAARPRVGRPVRRGRRARGQAALGVAGGRAAGGSRLMTELLALLLGLAVGAGSALVPVLNAEAYAVVAAGSATPGWVSPWPAPSPWVRPAGSWCCSRPAAGAAGALPGASPSVAPRPSVPVERPRLRLVERTRVGGGHGALRGRHRAAAARGGQRGRRGGRPAAYDVRLLVPRRPGRPLRRPRPPGGVRPRLTVNYPEWRWRQ